MKIYNEESLRNYGFWSGADDLAQYLTDKEMDTIENSLNLLYPEGIDETTLNDIFCHDKDSVAKWIGYNSFEDILAEREDAE